MGSQPSLEFSKKCVYHSVPNSSVPLIALLAFGCVIPTVLGQAEKTDSQNTSLSIVAGKYGHRPTFHCFIFGKTVRKLNRKKPCKHKIIYFELLVIES